MKLNKQVSLKYVIIALSLMAIISLGTVGYVISTTPSYPGTVSEVWVNPPFSEASYIVGVYNSTYYYAKNSTTGKFDYLSSNKTLVQLDAINNIKSTQGVILLKDITLASPLLSSSIFGTNILIVEQYNGVLKYYSNGALISSTSSLGVQVSNLYGASWVNSTNIAVTTLYCTTIDALTNSGVRILNLTVQSGTSFPSSPKTNQVFWRTDQGLLYVYNSSWVTIGYKTQTLPYANITGTPNLTVYLFANGTRALSGNWNIGGSHGVYGATFFNATVINGNSYYLNGHLIGYVEPASFIINRSGSTYRAWYGTNSTLAWSSTNANAVINNAIGNLTAGRTWQETVFLKGCFTLYSAIDLSGKNYTKLVIDGKLTLANNVNLTGAVIETTKATNNITIEGGIIDCNGDHQATGYGIGFQDVFNGLIDGVTVINAKQGEIFITNSGRQIDQPAHGNTVRNCIVYSRTNGIVSWTKSDYTQILNNRVCCLGKEQGDAIHTRDNKFTTISGNYIFNSSDMNIEVEAKEYNNIGASITSNTVLNGTHHGIYLHTFTGYTTNVEGATIENNKIAYNKENGISTYKEGGNIKDLSILGNTIFDNDQVNSGYSGIAVSAMYNFTIANNRIFDDQAIKTQNYAIEIHSACNFYTIINNNLLGNAVGAIEITSTGSTHRITENLGFVTENWGTFTNAANGQYINHGLAGTPTLVIVGSTNGTTFIVINAVNFGPSQFMLYMKEFLSGNNAHGQSGWWYAEYIP